MNTNVTSTQTSLFVSVSYEQTNIFIFRSFKTFFENDDYI